MEQSVSYIASQQFNLFSGEASAPQGLKLRDKVAYILEHHPDARDDDALLLYYYWLEFDNLADSLEPDALRRFKTWFAGSATNPETIRRRRQEIQQLRGEYGHLLPSEQVANYRKARDSAGPPRG